MIYDRYEDGEWRQTLRGLREVPLRNGVLTLGRRAGVDGRSDRAAASATRASCFLPVGTYAVTGMPTRLYEGPARDTYYAYHDGLAESSRAHGGRGRAAAAHARDAPSSYPVSPRGRGAGAQIVGDGSASRARRPR